jgi:hypothetical protein
MRTVAIELAADLREQWAHELAAVTVVPATGAAALSVVIDGERIYSIAANERPDSGQLNSEITARLGPPPGEGA